MAPRLVFRRAALWSGRGTRGAEVDVLVTDGRIAAVSEAPIPQCPGDWNVAAEGRLLLPGFVDTHAHLERRLARGLTAGVGFPRGHPQLEEPLRSRFERALSHADLAASARLALAEAALAGTTTVFGLCRAPACAEGSLAQLAGAADEIGLRAVFAYGASDHDGAFSVGVRENVAFCEARKAHPLVRGMAGLAHPDEVGDAALDALADLVARYGLHLHAGETEEELGVGYALHGRRLLDRLAALKLLTGRTLAAHLNHVSREETLALADAGCTCVFTPRAALWTEERPPRLEAALDAGAHGALGTDGVGSSLAAEFPASLALWRRSARPSATQGFYALERLISGGPRLVGRLFGSGAAAEGIREPGRVVVGEVADLGVLDDWGSTPAAQVASVGSATGGAPGTVAQLALVAGEARVAWTVVGGRVLVREGELLGQSLRELSRRGREQAEALWKRV